MNQVNLRIEPLDFQTEEAYKALRANLQFCGADKKAIVLTSCTPNEGKSNASLQLALSLAKSGKKTALIDADMRKSVMVDKYGLKKEDGSKIMGSSYYLANDIRLEDAVLHTQYEHGDIMPNNDNVVNPSILLENHKFEEMLDQLAEKYRYVFVDAPPLNLVSDGERIGSLCDGAVLVVRGNSTPKNIVKNSALQLERAGCPLLGVVLNRVKGAGGGYYYKQYGGHYGKGYGYGKEYGYGYGYYGDNK